jgi:hypothetical protein
MYDKKGRTMFLLPSSKTTTMHVEGFDRPAREPAHLPDGVLVRQARESDAARLRTLAHLDDRRLPAGPFLVAETTGETVAAMSLSTGDVIADPFRRTRDACDLLRLRAAQIAELDRRTAALAGERRAALKPAAI